LLIHGLVDFNLHIPSNALLFLLLANVAVAEFEVPVGSGVDRGNRSAHFSA
jgi:hypothetical protein